MSACVDSIYFMGHGKKRIHYGIGYEYCDHLVKAVLRALAEAPLDEKALAPAIIEMHKFWEKTSVANSLRAGIRKYLHGIGGQNG